jgi:DNA-binding MarR family transcriptional regulator
MPFVTNPRHRQDPILHQRVPIAEIFSFLKETSSQIGWSARELAKTLNIRLNDAKGILPILELQGYITRRGKSEWMTTTSGESIAGAKLPRFTRDAAERALSNLRKQIEQINADSDAEFRITKAVAFGDFLRQQPRVQPLDIGILLAARKPPGQSRRAQRRADASFLKTLRGRSAILNIHMYEDWMGSRSHINLLKK